MLSIRYDRSSSSFGIARKVKNIIGSPHAFDPSHRQVSKVVMREKDRLTGLVSHSYHHYTSQSQRSNVIEDPLVTFGVHVYLSILDSGNCERAHR